MAKNVVILVFISARYRYRTSNNVQMRRGRERGGERGGREGEGGQGGGWEGGQKGWGGISLKTVDYNHFLIEEIQFLSSQHSS